MGARLLAVSGLVFALAAGSGIAAGSGAAPQPARGNGPLATYGAYVATASDCAACHSAAGRGAYAGGLAIASPIGTIWSSNITPSRRFGIGLYTRDQFAAALRKGIRRDGAHLYPAMPYTAYARLTDHDIDALYAYFTTAVAPVETAARTTHLPFPANLRLAMAGWNLLFLDSGGSKSDPARSPAWNRGKYLVEGPAHCSTCHTPRGALMQERTGYAFTGGQVGGWYAPDVTSDKANGIGGWSKSELVEYLRTGIDRRHGARAGGAMAEAVEKSFSRLTTGDLSAIATYMLETPGPKDTAPSGPRFDRGAPASIVATTRGLPVGKSAAEDQGAMVFSGRCTTCHGIDGQGSRDGYYPALFHNPTTGADNSNLVATILYGVNRTATGHQAFMPGFGGKRTDANQMTDAEIALVANHVRHTYGIGDADVDATYVAMIRSGGPRSSLILVARIGIIVALLVVAGLALWLLRRRRTTTGSGTRASG